MIATSPVLSSSSCGCIRGPGAEIWDPATRSLIRPAGTPAPGNNAGAYPVNTALFTASRVGGYYPGLMCMPDGSVLFAQVGAGAALCYTGLLFLCRCCVRRRVGLAIALITFHVLM
jgi:hypothetical protein